MSRFRRYIGRAMHAKPSETAPEIQPLMTAQQVADYLNVTLAAVYLAINAGRLPRPCYPLSRAPRWRRVEIDAALERTRALPAEARAGRRQARLNRESSETSPSPEINAALE